jgi:hypothetical protein
MQDTHSEISRKRYNAIFFFSTLLSWAFINLIYFGLFRRMASPDYRIVLAWSGVLTFILWISFVLCGAYKIAVTNPFVFALLSAAYSGIVFLIIAKGIFHEYAIDNFFLGIAFLIGFISGLIYALASANSRLSGILHKHSLFKTAFTITPDILLIIFFCWTLPQIFSDNINAYLPYKTEEKELLQTLSGFKQGDSYEQLETAFPDYFQKGDQEDFVSSYDGPLFSYQIEVNKDTIVRLDVQTHKLAGTR